MAVPNLSKRKVVRLGMQALWMTHRETALGIALMIGAIGVLVPFSIVMTIILKAYPVLDLIAKVGIGIIIGGVGVGAFLEKIKTWYQEYKDTYDFLLRKEMR